MKKHLLLILICIITNASTLYAETWKIGVLVCVSGACAESGENSRKGIDLAIEDLNKLGGVLGKKVEYVLEDTAEGTSSGAGAVTAFKKLTTDSQLKYLIGPSWTPGALSVAPIAAAQSKLIIASPSVGISDFNKAGDNIFNFWPSDEEATKFLAVFAIKKNWKKVAIFSSQQPWESLQGQTFNTSFKLLGGEISSFQEPLPTDVDLRVQSLKIKNSEPDAVFLSNYTQMGVAAKQLRTIGYKGPLFAILMDETRIKTSQGALEETIFAGYPEPDSGFSIRFKEKFGIEPGIGADTTYDIVKLYVWAIENAGSFDVRMVQKEIASAKFSGASGNIEFDEYGGVIKVPTLYQVKNSKKALYE